MSRRAALASTAVLLAALGCATGIRERVLRRPDPIRLGCGAIDSLALAPAAPPPRARMLLRVVDARKATDAGPLFGTASRPVMLHFPPEQDLRATVGRDAGRVLASTGIAVLDSSASPGDSATAHRASIAILAARTDWFTPLLHQGFVTGSVSLDVTLTSSDGAPLWSANLVSHDTTTASYITAHTHQLALAWAYCREMMQLRDSIAVHTVRTVGSRRH